MKKIVLLFALFALFAQNSNAECITVDQAKAIAQQQLAKTTKASASDVKMTLSHAGMSMRGAADYYVFNRDGGQGYVIVSGDDVVSPVLAYSNKGSFDFNQAPEYLQYLLDVYQYTLEYLRENPQTAPSTRYNPAGVYPLFMNEYGEFAHWDQFAPYNSYYPSYNGERCLAGCVPIAWAHIMKGMKYPEYGNGSNTFTYELGGTIRTATANFNHRYKYNSMRNSYTATSSGWQDCAQMIYDIAVAFNTKFSTESSNASYHHVMKAIVAYFDYNPNLQFTQKKNYAEQSWRDMIYNELDNGHPVFYFGYRTISNSGADTYVGHAFAVDGYDSEGRIRITWGFSPNEYNSYFSFDLLSPRIYGDTPYEHDEFKEGFNTDQGAIIGICPDTTDLGGVVIKNVELMADTMSSDNIHATINVQALSGKYAGTLRYGIVSKTVNDNKVTYTPIYTFPTSVDLADNEMVGINIDGAYPYLTNGETYYIVVWSPFFPNNYDWNWFHNDPKPFVIGEVTPPIQPGDVQGDNDIDMDDLTALIDYLVYGSMTGIDPVGANVNEVGDINMDDLTALINILVYGHI